MKSKARVCTLFLGSDSDSEISKGLMNQYGELTYRGGKILRAEEVIGQAEEVVESYFRSLPKTHMQPPYPEGTDHPASLLPVDCGPRR